MCLLPTYGHIFNTSLTSLSIYCVFVCTMQEGAVSLITIKGLPTLHLLDPLHYLVTGDPFTLNCTAEDDPQSPNGTQFLWYRDDIDITNETRVTANNNVYTSQLNIHQLDSDQYSGKYLCIAYNNPSANVTSSTTLIVES